VSLGKRLNDVFHLGVKQSTRCGGPAKDMQAEQLLCWSGMTDTKHSTTYGLNEEAIYFSKLSTVQ